jgi:DNA polymerase delta subunit 1
MAGSVPAAVSFVEGEVTRLLTGHVGAWQLAMTGGLWRVTGQQLERAAAAGGASGCGVVAAVRTHACAAHACVSRVACACPTRPV